MLVLTKDDQLDSSNHRLRHAFASPSIPLILADFGGPVMNEPVSAEKNFPEAHVTGP